MPRVRTFKILKWDDLPEGHAVSLDYDLVCQCGREAFCPVAEGGVIEARAGMAFVFDPQSPPPEFYRPQEIQCRKCGRIYQR